MDKRVEAARHHEFHRNPKDNSSMECELVNSQHPPRIQSAVTQGKDLSYNGRTGVKAGTQGPGHMTKQPSKD